MHVSFHISELAYLSNCTLHIVKKTNKKMESQDPTWCGYVLFSIDRSLSNI